MNWGGRFYITGTGRWSTSADEQNAADTEKRPTPTTATKPIRHVYYTSRRKSNIRETPHRLSDIPICMARNNKQRMQSRSTHPPCIVGLHRISNIEHPKRNPSSVRYPYLPGAKKQWAIGISSYRKVNNQHPINPFCTSI